MILSSHFVSAYSERLDAPMVTASVGGTALQRTPQVPVSVSFPGE